MRLIDADKADVEQISCYYGGNCRIEDVQEWLNAIPTVDAVEVVHGRWKKNRNEKTCSECHFIYYSNNDEWNYCPNCGAKMDGERRNDG